MQTHVTSREVANAMASDCVEGTPVRSTDGITIGTIEGVIIDKASGNVSYAVLSCNGSVQMRRRHLAIPWHGLTYDRKTATYNLRLAENDLIALSRTSAAGHGNRGTKTERSDDGVEAYWGIAETW
jgi:sporulation protein YlmC with PRC-barrel domain